MFRLTRRERCLVAGLLLAFLVGMAVKHYRDTAPLTAQANPIQPLIHADR